MQASRWLNYVITYFTTKQQTKLLHVSQLVRIICAAARRKNCGGGGFSKFRLAWWRAEFFPAAAARQGAGWRRRQNTAPEGSNIGHYIIGGKKN